MVNIKFKFHDMKSFIAACAASAVAAHGYSSHHHHPSYQTSSTYDPWTASQSVGVSTTTGWYSPYQQYSPPKIAFNPGTSKETEFAICQFPKQEGLMSTPSVADKGAFIKFAQAPGKATSVKIYFPLCLSCP